jgi:hypothetical protein
MPSKKPSPYDYPDISRLFNKFSGREVPMLEVKHVVSLGKPFATDVKLADPQHPVIKEMRNVARENGLSLTLSWPGVPLPKDYKADRVNVHIEKASDGKWRVSKFGRG